MSKHVSGGSITGGRTPAASPATRLVNDGSDRTSSASRQPIRAIMDRQQSDGRHSDPLDVAGSQRTMTGDAGHATDARHHRSRGSTGDRRRQEQPSRPQTGLGPHRNRTAGTAGFNLVMAAAFALAILCLDVLSPLQGAAAVLYTIVVLIAARSQRLGAVVVAGIVSWVLAFVGYGAMHWGAPLGSPAMRLAVSVVAVGITTALAVQHQVVSDAKHRSDEWYRTIFDSAGLPIWESDWSDAYAMIAAGDVPDADLAARAGLTAHIRDANQAAARLFGFGRREDLLGRNISYHHTADAVAALARMFGSLVRGEDPIEEETQFRTLAGDVVDVVLRVTLPPGHDGWRHVLVMALDVTERNRAQDNLAQARAELAKVSRLTTLGELAASIAHEINQPLSAVITYAQSGERWLTRDEPNTAEAADCLNHIALNASRAAQIVTRIRNVARKGEVEPTIVAVGSLIEDTVALLARELEGNAIRVHLAIEDGVPEVVGDRVQIQQVLMNLMMNASQAMSEMPEDGRLLEIELLADGGGIVVLVRDTGPGLPPAASERLFNPFFTTKADGLGLGLSICRSIVESHGGTLTARNDPDGGAMFRIWLRAGVSSRKAAA